ncbi:MULTISPECIES: histidine phosphatase family protein [Arthrobacter]|uniref:Histidine phosphatase family protein n=2 Tax=Arthrobacter TaxID=1663 RepID=A0ABU9KIL8_9MICC|nr:histidine phosphatase family protein [Arthrobacter sp. YJM1]MDP5226321.1 histidine phosphatase family protein [Arthrobacter sp. YJM1]
MRIYFIRHGQTPSNVEGALDTAFPGAALSGLGEAQAAALPAAFETLGLRGVYVSPLLRTRQTAAPLAAALGLEAQVLPGLAEIPAGELEMLSDDGSLRRYVDCVRAWMHGELGRAMPGGPDGHTFVDRFDAAIASIAARHADDDAVAVVSHGAAIRCYAALRTDLTEERRAGLMIMNTGGAVVDGRPGAWRLTHWQTEPFGGAALEDRSAEDVTGGVAPVD